MSNRYRVIKLLVFVTGFCIVSCTTALAQQSPLFVYLQSENWQPFYVQIGDKVYSSSSIGHLVISGLPDKTCNFEIGFSNHAIQPQRFAIPLHNRDHGYQLVKNGSRGWALQDWQTDEIIKPLKEAGSSALLYGERKKDDAFATLMAAVVNDSAVLYTSIVKKESEAVPTVAAKTDEKKVEKQPVAKKEEKAEPAVDSAVSVVKAENVDVVVPPNTPPPPVSTVTASLVKAETVGVDTTQAIKTADTLVTKYDPKEKPLNEKPDKPAGVAKIQQQSKDGETKMVFVDSSESPAKVVTVYIAEEKKTADSTAATSVPKTETKQDVVLPSVKQELTVEVVKSEEKTGKDSAKTTPAGKEETTEKIKKETWRPAPEKKAPAADTATIILESKQMKKSTGGAEPLYKPKQEPKAETAKPAVEEIKTEEKQEPVKPATEEKVKVEPAKPVVAEAKKESEPKPAAVTDTAASAGKSEAKAVMTKPAEPEKPKAVEPEKKPESGSKLVMINSDCGKLASDNDVDKLRVKMMVENDLQKKLAVANKSFKTMCLYARQIKGLSELFPSDEAKYKFLELAYPFAADTANFKQLHELLTEEVYITKFKKLVRLE